MSKPALAAAAAAAAAVCAWLWRRQRRQLYSRLAPVLCFGDSITEGYMGIWHHPTFAPARSDPTEWPSGELEPLRLHPYAIHLGAALSAEAGEAGGGYKTALCHAVARAYSGWTAAEMLAALTRELAAGPWRAVVICAGSNDVVLGASAEATLPLVRALHAACDRHGVPVVVVPNPDCDMAHHGLCKDPARQRAELTKLAAMLADGAAAAGRAVADARAAMPMDAAHAHLWDDSIHPSPAGSRALAQAVHAAMRKHGL
jgi:lysophospholipase L1-like esterase